MRGVVEGYANKCVEEKSKALMVEEEEEEGVRGGDE
jgi:hypothetical protein